MEPLQSLSTIFAHENCNKGNKGTAEICDVCLNINKSIPKYKNCWAPATEDDFFPLDLFIPQLFQHHEKQPLIVDNSESKRK